MSTTQNGKPFGMLLGFSLALLAPAMAGCGDDAGCPAGTMLRDGACVPIEDAGVMDGGGCIPTGDETCDGLDEDCDGMVDEGFALTTFYTDADEDGFGDDAAPVEACGAMPGLAEVGGDCDDGNADVSPDATEICNGVDDDCNRSVDEGLLRAADPIPLGIQGLSLFDNFMPYGDGYFFAYYDSAANQALYFLIDVTGTVTAGPLRIAMTPVNDLFVYAVAIDDERIAIIWPEETSPGNFDMLGRVLNPAAPGTSTDAQVVIPDLVGNPYLAVLDDRIVVWDTPRSTDPADAPGRAFSFDLDFADPSGEVMVPRVGGQKLLFVGLPGLADAYLLRTASLIGEMTPVLDVRTLELGTPATGGSPMPTLLLLESPPPRGYGVASLGPGSFFEIGYALEITPEGVVTQAPGTTTGLPVADGFGGFAITPHVGETFLAMTCYDGGASSGECGYQFTAVGEAEPLTDVLPVVSPTVGGGFVLPQLAANGTHLAAIVPGGDLSVPDGVPELHFVPFTCPAP